MPADAFGVPMFDRRKEPAPAVFQGEDLRSVGAPHDIGSASDYLALVKIRCSLRYPVWREQVVLPHDAQNPFAPDLVPFDEAQAAPDLAMTFTLKHRGCQVIADEGKQI